MSAFPSISPQSNLAAFAFPNGSSRVYYLTSTGAVIEISGSGPSWAGQEIATGSGGTLKNTQLIGLCLSNGYLRIYYQNGASEIIELAWSGSSWVSTDIGAEAASALPVTNTALAALSLPNGNIHVYYLSSGLDIIQLVGSGSSWVGNNLTAIVGAVLPMASTPLAAFSLPNGDIHVYYLSSGLDIIQLVGSGSSWVGNNLTVSAGAVPPAENTSLAAFPLPNDGFRIYYVSGGYDLNELAWSGLSWAKSQLVQIVGTGGTPVAAFPLPNGNSRVYFFSFGHVIEWSGSGSSWTTKT